MNCLEFNSPNQPCDGSPAQKLALWLRYHFAVRRLANHKQAEITDLKAVWGRGPRRRAYRNGETSDLGLPIFFAGWIRGGRLQSEAVP